MTVIAHRAMTSELHRYFISRENPPARHHDVLEIMSVSNAPALLEERSWCQEFCDEGDGITLNN